MPDNIPHDEISQLIETHVAEAVTIKSSNFKQTIALLLTLITMIVGAALWATNSHASIKDWTAEQDYVTKKQLQDVIKEQYVKKEDFVIVREKLDGHEKNHEQLMKTLDKMDEKLDRLERLQSRTDPRRTR